MTRVIFTVYIDPNEIYNGDADFKSSQLAKNYNALEALVTLGIHCFWHQTDKYTITSQGWIWAYPGQPGGKYTIAVHPERLTNDEVKKFAGVCSDYIDNYKETS